MKIEKAHLASNGDPLDSWSFSTRIFHVYIDLWGHFTFNEVELRMPSMSM